MGLALLVGRLYSCRKMLGVTDPDEEDGPWRLDSVWRFLYSFRVPYPLELRFKALECAWTWGSERA